MGECMFVASTERSRSVMNKNTEEKVVIMGASSGLGDATARLLSV